MDVAAIEETSLADQGVKRHTSAPAGMSEKENRHGPAPKNTSRNACVTRDWARVFRIVDRPTIFCQTTHETLPRNRFLLHRHPFGTPVGSNTETDDDCWPATFHRGGFRCESPLLDFTIPDEFWTASVKRLYLIENKKKESGTNILDYSRLKT
jgi:hypothetical protein